MGGEESKGNELQDDYFLLEHLSKMNMQNRKMVSYYCICAQNTSSLAATLTMLRQYFKIEHFPTVKTLKQEMVFVNKQQIVKVIVTKQLPAQDLTYIQSEPKIRQVVVWGAKLQGQKIAGAGADGGELVKVLNELEEKDSLEIPANNVLLMIDQDTKILNKYRLNYHCNTHSQLSTSAKKDFLELARTLLPQKQAEITQFDSEYEQGLAGEKRRQVVLEWAFRDSFYWDMLYGLTRNTTDPKRLAYLRLPVKDLYECISEEYRAKKLYEPFYILTEINEAERVKLGQLQQNLKRDEKLEKNFLLFSSFVRGTTDEKETIAQQKRNPNLFRFLVSIYMTQIPQGLDFGYVKRGNKTLVNIYNVFQVDMMNVKTRRGELLYGILPIMDRKRREEKSRGEMTKLQLDLTRNYDYLEDLMSRVDSQATLLQLSGYYKESLEVYDKKVDFIRRTNESDQTMNRCLVKKADALTLTGEYEAAEKEYLSVQSKSQTIKAICLIHLAELYLRRGETEKLDKVVQEFQPMLQRLQQHEKQEFFKGSHLVALRTLRRGSAKKAEAMLWNLITSASSIYKHNLQGKPIVHDIYRSLAASQSKQGKHAEALQLLNDTRSWQLACEGKTHNVALTETLIQSVCRSSNNQEELSKSLSRMEDLSTEISSSEARLQSSAMMSLNQSMVKIDM